MRSTWTMTSKLRATALGLGLGLASAFVGSLAGGCLVTNANHCGINQGACGDGLMCSVCAVDNNGCVAPDAILDPGCMFGGGTTTQGPTSATDTSTGTVNPTTTESTVEPTLTTSMVDPTTAGPTTEPTITTTVDPSDTSSGTTVGPECAGPVVDNPDCTGDTPYCVEEKCLGCPDVACGTIDVNKPACVEGSGVCVQCQEHGDCLDADKPACDKDTATCKGCSEHEECPETACDLETGMCMPAECVYYVKLTKSGMFPCNDANDGKTTETTLCTLQKAATLLKPNEPCTIKVTSGSLHQSLPTEIAAGPITVAIVHYGTTPNLTVPNNPALTINAGNRVYMNRISITDAGNPAIECTGGVLWLDNQRINNTGTALHALDCEVHVRRTILFGHSSGALDIQGMEAGKAKLWVENSYITSMNSNVFGAIRLIGSAEADLLYTTIALVKSAVPPIECVVGFTGAIDIRNSAIIGPLPRYGAMCMPKLDIVTSYESTEGTQAALAETFSTFGSGQFQAQPEGPLRDVAMWMPGDPAVDHDGTPRPKVAGPDFAGADRPVP